MGIAGAYTHTLAVHHPLRLQKAQQEACQAGGDLLERDVGNPLPGFVETHFEPFGQSQADLGFLLDQVVEHRDVQEGEARGVESLGVHAPRLSRQGRYVPEQVPGSDDLQG